MGSYGKKYLHAFHPLEGDSSFQDSIVMKNVVVEGSPSSRERIFEHIVQWKEIIISWRKILQYEMFQEESFLEKNPYEKIFVRGVSGQSFIIKGTIW